MLNEISQKKMTNTVLSLFYMDSKNIFYPAPAPRPVSDTAPIHVWVFKLTLHHG